MQILSLYKKRVALKEKLVQMLHYDHSGLWNLELRIQLYYVTYIVNGECVKKFLSH